MAEAVPLSPEKDEGSPLPSPSNPDIETTETEQAQQSLISINDTDDKSNTQQQDNDNINDDNNDKQDEEDKNDNDNDDNNTEIKPSISMILDTEAIPDTHIREAQMSTTKIMNIAKQLDKDKNPQNDDGDDDGDNEEKQEIQKQIQIKVEHGHTSKQGIRPSMEVLFCSFVLLFVLKSLVIILALINVIITYYDMMTGSSYRGINIYNYRIKMYIG